MRSEVDMPEDYMTPEDICDLVPGVTINTLAIWRHYRRGPDFVQVGRRVFYQRDVVRQWLESVTRHCDPDVSHLPRRP
jgi:hypothetical protein